MFNDEGTFSNDEWINCWSVGETDFHQSKHDRFLDNKEEEFFGGSKSVFVPLCGKSLDILWLYKHGHAVCGVEIAEQAIQEFFQENSIEFDVEEISSVGKLYKSKDGRLQLYVANMFDMSPELCGQFDIILDSKAFVAINRSDRQKYIDVVLSLMKEGGQYYLAAIEYDPAVWPGPPHPTPVEVINSSYNERCNIELLKDEDQVIKKKSSTSADSGEALVPKQKYIDLQSAFGASSYLIFRWYKMTLKQ